MKTILNLLIQLLKQLNRNMEASAKFDRLWSIEDCAEYANVGRKMIYEIKDRPDFPAPIIISKNPRYKPEEIVAYFDSLRAE